MRNRHSHSNTRLCLSLTAAGLLGLQTLVIQAQSASNKIHFSSEKDQIQLPNSSTQGRKLDTGLSLFNGESSTSPAFDIPLGSMSTRSSSSLNNYKLWDHYDQKRNWIFMDSKELQAKTNAEQGLGANQGKWKTTEDRPPNRMEEFIQGNKKPSADKKSESLSSTSKFDDSGRFDKEEDPFKFSNQSGSSLDPNGLQRLSVRNFEFDRTVSKRTGNGLNIDPSNESMDFLKAGRVDFSNFGREDVQFGGRSPSNDFQKKDGAFPWSQKGERQSALEKIMGDQPSYHPLEQSKMNYWNSMGSDPTNQGLNGTKPNAQNEFAVRSPVQIDFSQSREIGGEFNPNRSSVLDELGRSPVSTGLSGILGPYTSPAPASSTPTYSANPGAIFEWSARKF